jgi:hypothetical protein
MAYIATYAKNQGLNVGILDAEALGLGVKQSAQLINQLAPRWVGFNLLAPTYEMSAQIAATPRLEYLDYARRAPSQSHAHGGTCRSKIQ